jgi:hypothetical protein
MKNLKVEKALPTLEQQNAARREQLAIEKISDLPY